MINRIMWAFIVLDILATLLLAFMLWKDIKSNKIYECKLDMIDNNLSIMIKHAELNEDIFKRNSYKFLKHRYMILDKSKGEIQKNDNILLAE